MYVASRQCFQQNIVTFTSIAEENAKLKNLFTQKMINLVSHCEIWLIPDAMNVCKSTM